MEEAKMIGCQLFIDERLLELMKEFRIEHGDECHPAVFFGMLQKGVVNTLIDTCPTTSISLKVALELANILSEDIKMMSNQLHRNEE
jgi:hypothetical protein